MKSSKLLLLLLVLMGFTSGLAQTRIAREVHIGVIGGPVMSSYSFSPKISQDQAMGYTFGIAGRYIEEKIFGLQFELLLTRRGEKDRFDNYPDLNFQRDYLYVEVPVLAHMYFALGNKSDITFDIGPKLGYFLSDKITSHLEGEDWEKLQNSSYHKYQHHEMPVEKKFDYGLQGGLGYEFKLSDEMSLQLQGRYYFGLGNMFPDKKSDVFEISSNQQIQITASLWFRTQIAKYKLQRKIRQYNKK